MGLGVVVFCCKRFSGGRRFGLLLLLRPWRGRCHLRLRRLRLRHSLSLALPPWVVSDA